MLSNIWPAAHSLVSQSITTAQHANTIQLEILIVTMVLAALGGIYKIGRDTGSIKTGLADLTDRVSRIETKADNESTDQRRERDRVQRRDR